VERPHGLPRAALSATGESLTSTISTRTTSSASSWTGGRRIRPGSAGVITAGTMPVRKTGSSPCGTAGPTSRDSRVGLRPRSPVCCASVAGRVLRAAAALGAR
jgi:hypothetical protein